MVLPLPFVALLAYLAGCLNAGYYCVRILYGKDIRQSGSGTAGARNAGRLYGPAVFVLVFLLDCAKGAALTAMGVGISTEYAAVCAVAVVVGHVWPVQLKFRGGKGMASALGALLLLAPLGLLCVALSALAAKLLAQPLARGGIAGFWLAALGALLRHEPLPLSIGTALLALILTISHRHNLTKGA